MAKTVTVLFSGTRDDDSSDLLAFAHVKEKHFDAEGALADKKLIRLINKLFALDDGKFDDYPYLTITHLSSRVKPRTECWAFDANEHLGTPTRKIDVMEAGRCREFFLQSADDMRTQAPEL
jgi:hypothetical protein